MDNLKNKRHGKGKDQKHHLSQVHYKDIYSRNKINRRNAQQNIKILIVEDNFIVQCALKEMLSNLGHKADIAGDGKTALALYNDDYCLILMDIDLPDISGLEVTQTIRSVEREKNCHVPIIAMTSHSDDPEYQDKFKAAGMDGFSGKPNAAQLKALIETYASH